MSTPVIALGDLNDPRVLRLLDDHLADMYATSPPESVHALDVSGLQHPDVTFWALARFRASIQNNSSTKLSFTGWDTP